MSANHDVRFYDERNGYIRCHVDRETWRADFVAVDAEHPDGASSVIASWALQDGRPAASRV